MKGATERSREACINLNVREALVAQRNDCFHFLEDLGVRLSNVGNGMWLANRDRQCDFLHARIECCLRALEVGHQSGDIQVGQGESVRNDLSRISHLRHQFRGYEGAHLDFPQPGLCQRCYPLKLELSRHGGLDALQAVARPHFAHQDVDIFRVFHSGSPHQLESLLEHSRNAARMISLDCYDCSVRQNYVLFLVSA
ncbi:hypothetical protein D3C76_1106450 [compost metagenome]